MTGVVCLQGGAEFGPGCVAMDTAFLARAGEGPVAVVALAATPGHDYDAATERAVSYYAGLGAVDVRAVPDARTDPTGALSALSDARVVVLPGGSPRRLLDGLRATGVAEVLTDVLADGGAVSGASAGAMVLCEWTLLPERGEPELVPGLGVVEGVLVLPHFSGDLHWLDAVREDLPGDVVALGLPECAGVLADGAGFRSLAGVGDAATRLLGARDEVLAVGSSTRL